MQYDVFISYSRRDYIDANGNPIKGNIVSKIKDTLKKNGISYWIDEDGINSGDAFAQLITNSIKNSKVVIFISSENSNNSEWTRKEIAAAVHYKKKIIPFKYDETPFNDAVYLYLADLDFISYRTMGENALSRLVTSVKKYQESQQDTIEPAQKPEVKPVAKPEDKRPWKTILLVAALALVLVYALVMTFKQPKTTEPEAAMTEMKEEMAEEKEEKPIVAAVENKEAEKPVVKEEKSVETPKPAKKTVVSDVSVKVNGVVFDMIAVRGGTFEMGATSEQAAYASDNESPKHKVTLDDFRIGKYEVTQKQWEAVMGSKVWELRNRLSPLLQLRGEGDDYPVYYVSLNDCKAFIAKLNSLTGKTFRLPTEAEWEYVARGGSHPNGKVYGDSDAVDDYAWYEDNSDNLTHAVGNKAPNSLGVYDMLGNVSEWCSDKYGKYRGGATTNPKGPSSGDDNVVRGGGWASTADNCRVSSRMAVDASVCGDDIGFRLVLE